jgi:hypothetical protein
MANRQKVIIITPSVKKATTERQLMIMGTTHKIQG